MKSSLLDKLHSHFLSAGGGDQDSGLPTSAPSLGRVHSSSSKSPPVQLLVRPEPCLSVPAPGSRGLASGPLTSGPEATPKPGLADSHPKCPAGSAQRRDKSQPVASVCSLASPSLGLTHNDRSITQPHSPAHHFRTALFLSLLLG